MFAKTLGMFALALCVSACSTGAPVVPASGSPTLASPGVTGLAATVSTLAPPAGPPKMLPFFKLKRVGPNVWAAIAVQGSHAGGNTGIIIGTDSVAVVDSFESADAAQALMVAIRNLTDLPVRYVIDTHYHYDHVGGNAAFVQSGAVVLAQRNVRVWEHTENLKFFGDKITPQVEAAVGALALPSIVYRDGIELYLGDRKVIVRVLPGHTGGDSVVIVPDANVVFTGDLFWNHSLPNLIDANTLQQIATDETLMKDYPDAVFVPGHGDVGDTEDVSAFRDYLVELRKEIRQAQAEHKSGQALEEDILPRLQGQYGTWNYFDYFARPNIEQTVQELAGTKHVPVPAS